MGGGAGQAVDQRIAIHIAPLRLPGHHGVLDAGDPLVADLRGVVDRQHGDLDRSHLDHALGIGQHIGEFVAAVEIGIRQIDEGTARPDRDGTVGGQRLQRQARARRVRVQRTGDPAVLVQILEAGHHDGPLLGLGVELVAPLVERRALWRLFGRVFGGKLGRQRIVDRIEVDAAILFVGTARVRRVAAQRVQLDEAAAALEAGLGGVVGRHRLGDQHVVGLGILGAARHLARVALERRDDPLGRGVGDRGDQVAAQIEDRDPAHLAVGIGGQGDLCGRDAAPRLDLGQHRGAADAHRRRRGVHVHAAGARHLPGDEHEAALDQVERAAVALPGGGIDQLVDDHPAAGREGEDRAVDEGDRQRAAAAGLDHVVEEDLGADGQRLAHPVGALHAGLAADGLDLADGIGALGQAGLGILPGRLGTGQARREIAAQHRPIGRLEIRRLGRVEIAGDAQLGRAGVADHQITTVAGELRVEEGMGVRDDDRRALGRRQNDGCRRGAWRPARLQRHRCTPKHKQALCSNAQRLTPNRPGAKKN